MLRKCAFPLPIVGGMLLLGILTQRGSSRRIVRQEQVENGTERVDV